MTYMDREVLRLRRALIWIRRQAYVAIEIENASLARVRPLNALEVYLRANRALKIPKAKRGDSQREGMRG